MKILLVVIGLLVAILSLAGADQTNPPLRLVQIIPLPNVEGYFDHPDIDVKGQRLFVPGEYQETIEIVDLRAGKVIHSIVGLGGHPRKIVYVPGPNQIWVDLANGTCKVFSGNSYELVKTIQLNPGFPPEAKREPDNGIYDAGAQRVYYADRARSQPEAKGSIEIVDVARGAYVGAVPIADSDPAGLALDDKSSKLFVVLGETSTLAVVDRRTWSVIASWPITGGPLPHALGFDAAHHRLFVGSRVHAGHLYKPGKMVVMDSDTGKVVQVLDTEGGVDEIQYESESQRIYLTGTTGAVDVFKQLDPDHYELIAKVPTSPIAKTSLLVPELKRFYVMVPKHVVLTPPIPQEKEATIEDARILVFEMMS